MSDNQADPVSGDRLPLFRAVHPLVLASASPRRRDMLRHLGLSFGCHPVDSDEQPLPGEEPRALVMRLARAKAEEAAISHPHAWALGADTIVVCDSKILGKPVDAVQALAMLHTLNNSEHIVITGYALVNMTSQRALVRAVQSSVVFADNPVSLLESYVATGEPLDKAGAYGIQGLGGTLVHKINGSYTTIVGLPLAEVVSDLLQLKIIDTRSPAPHLRSC